MEEKKENENLKSKRKKKILIFIAAFVVLFFVANVFATTQGYNNIFFMIRNLFINEEVIEKDEILLDRDITMSYEYISIADKLKIQINNLKIKDGEAELTTIIKQNRMSGYDPYKFVVYDVTEGKNIEVGNQLREKPESEIINGVWIDSYVEYEDVEVIKLSNIANDTNILRLEIKEQNEEDIAIIEINLSKREIDVISCKTTNFEKLSETELKEALAEFAILNYNKDLLFEDIKSNEIEQNYLKVYLAHELIWENNFETNGDDSSFSKGFSLEETNLAISEYLGEYYECELQLPENAFCYYDEKSSSYKYNAGDSFIDPLCVEIEDLTYQNGTYIATFIYCYPGEYDYLENNIGNLAMYKTTMKFKVNEEYIYSKYCLIDADEIESSLVKSAVTNNGDTMIDSPNDEDNKEETNNEDEKNKESNSDNKSNDDNKTNYDKEDDTTNTVKPTTPDVPETNITDIAVTEEEIKGIAEKYILLNFYKDRDVHTEHYTDDEYRNEMKILTAFKLDFGHPSSPTQYISIDKTIVYEIITTFTGEKFDDTTTTSKLIFNRDGNFFEYIGKKVYDLEANIINMEKIEKVGENYNLQFTYSYNFYPDDIYRATMTLEKIHYNSNPIARQYVKFRVNPNEIKSEFVRNPNNPDENMTSEEELKQVVQDYILVNFYKDGNANLSSIIPEEMYINEARIMAALQIVTDGPIAWNNVSVEKNIVYDVVKAFTGEELGDKFYRMVVSYENECFGYATQFGPTYIAQVIDIENIEYVDGIYKVTFTYKYNNRVTTYRATMNLKPVTSEGLAAEYVKYQIVGDIYKEEI